MSNLRVQVKQTDIHRASRDRRVCPISLAVSRRFKESVENVDVQRNAVYIWDEYDSYSSVYVYADDEVCSFFDGWELYRHDISPNLEFEPFEFSLVKRERK